MNLKTRLTMRFLLQLGLLVVLQSVVYIGIMVAARRATIDFSSKERVTAASILEHIPKYTTLTGSTVSIAPTVLSKVAHAGDWLQVLDGNGRQIYAYRVPNNIPTHYSPGYLVYEHSKSDLGYTLHTWYAELNGQSITWIVGEKAKSYSGVSLLQLILAFGLSLVGLPLLVALLFGRRLGAPLLHMMSWLQGLATGTFDEPKDTSGTPRSRNASGKIRRSYQVYREVLAALNNLSLTLARNEAEYRKLEQTREEWITGVSHDLKTPLSTVKGYGDLLSAVDYSWTEAETRGFAKIVSEKAEYMENLIEDLNLTFRLKNEDLPLERRPQDIVEFVRRLVIQLINTETHEHQEVTFNSYSDYLIYPFDTHWLGRALENLLSNAVLHNPPETSVKVQVKPVNAFDYIHSGVKISISDNGRGMDEETVEHLFDRYYRGTNTNPEHSKSSGLGTAVAKQLIESHGGQIDVHSVPGEGTNITITLPPQNEILKN
ncbi:sensor histidine kinase KdpD [Alicyclobacillus sp. SO9]|uniref:sensor histidine kinase n=1 Tax=Alicyclobacillus sp. SO9 TaxID=2665646 RepID=UPI0018E795D0|nr:HAMP domain-containing sensor histidine kinase [Alicyclobacillus sp. SO9]QQE80079.1 HAMP domain-containing histidine kinase [Alicyclobacillus sp. SO9]